MEKRIALCLHGYFNSSRDGSSKGVDGYHHIRKHILSKGKVDIYIHSWDLFHRHEIESLYSDWIIRSCFQEQIDFKPLYYGNELGSLPMRNEATPFWNVFSQFYSVQQAFSLMLASQRTYDVVIKARFDLGRINRATSGPGLGNPYPVQCINFDPMLPMDAFYMADWQYLETEGPADMWFYSSMDNMKAFATLYDIAASDVRIGSDYEKWAGSEDGGMLNTIKAWKWFLIKTGLWNKKQTLQTHWE